LHTAACALAFLSRHRPGMAEEVLAEELPWLPWLPAVDQNTCVRDLLASLVTASRTNDFLPFARQLVAWRAMAEAWSELELATL
jgi:hypothetical protein